MDQILMNMIAAFTVKPGVPMATLEQAASELGRHLPQDYLELLSVMNGGEGFIGDDLIRIYSIEQVMSLYRKLSAEGFANQILIIGSNGGGEAFALSYREPELLLIKQPFIPLDLLYAEPCGSSVSEFLISSIENTAMPISKSERCSTPASRVLIPNPNPSLRPGNPYTVGKEIYEKLPILFGGHPASWENKLLMPFDEYVQMVVYWNNYYRNVICKKPS